MSDNTARQPKGRPTGGQFAATAKSEADLDSLTASDAFGAGAQPDQAISASRLREQAFSNLDDENEEERLRRAWAQVIEDKPEPEESRRAPHAQSDRETAAGPPYLDIEDWQRVEMTNQINPLNRFAISGGRVEAISDGIRLPVSNGYAVEVHLDQGNDTYTVERVFTRGGKRWVKGARTNVYCDELSEAAYYASCFRSYDEGEWESKR